MLNYEQMFSEAVLGRTKRRYLSNTQAFLADSSNYTSRRDLPIKRDWEEATTDTLVGEVSGRRFRDD